MSQNPQDIQLYPFDFTVLSGGPLAPYPQSYPLFPDCTMFDDWLDRPFRSVSPASSITDWNETHAAAAQRDPFARAGTFSYHEALPNFCTVEDLFVCGAGAGFEGTSDSFQDHHHGTTICRISMLSRMSECHSSSHLHVTKLHSKDNGSPPPLVYIIARSWRGTAGVNVIRPISW